MSIRIASLILAFFFTAGGILSLSVAICNADWFFKSHGVKALTGNTHRTLLRVIYGIIGVAILFVAFLIVRSTALL